MSRSDLAVRLPFLSSFAAGLARFLGVESVGRASGGGHRAALATRFAGLLRIEAMRLSRRLDRLAAHTGDRAPFGRIHGRETAQLSSGELVRHPHVSIKCGIGRGGSLRTPIGTDRRTEVGESRLAGFSNEMGAGSPCAP